SSASACCEGASGQPSLASLAIPIAPLNPSSTKNPRQPYQRGFPNYCLCPGALGLSDSALKLVQRGILQIFERLLGLGHDGGESLRLSHGHVGQQLAVDLDARPVQPVDQAPIGQPRL